MSMIGVKHTRRSSHMSFSGKGNTLSQTMNSSKMSKATREALDAIHVKHVSQAKEYETFKQLPKFSHIPLAVIHPAVRDRRRAPIKATPDMEKEINISPARIAAKENKVKDIPESLLRPPVTVGRGGSSASKKRKQRPVSVEFGGSQPRFGEKSENYRN